MALHAQQCQDRNKRKRTYLFKHESLQRCWGFLVVLSILWSIILIKNNSNTKYCLFIDFSTIQGSVLNTTSFLISWNSSWVKHEFYLNRESKKRNWKQFFKLKLKKNSEVVLILLLAAIYKHRPHPKRPKLGDLVNFSVHR